MKPTKSNSNRNIKTSNKKEVARCENIKSSEHKLILKFLNEAVRVEDLMFGMPSTIHAHPTDPHPEHVNHDVHRREIIKSEAAKKIIELRNRKFPLGFRHWEDLQIINGFRPEWLDNLIFSFSNAVLGEWNDFPVDIPRRGNMSRDGIVHAIMLKSGQVLFITGDETTMLWDPEDTTATTFEDPTNQPHLMPLGYSQVCSCQVSLRYTMIF